MPGIHASGGGGGGGGSWLYPTTLPLFPGPLVGAAPGADAPKYFRIVGKGTISAIGLHIITSAGNIFVGVYRNTGAGRSANPAARAATSGAVASPGTGYREIALTAAVSVADGDWFAINFSDGGCAVRQTHADDGSTEANGYRGYEIGAGLPATAATMEQANVGIIHMVGVP